MNNEQLKSLGLSDDIIQQILDDQGKNFIPKFRFNEINRDALVLGKDGKVSGLKEQVEDLRKTKPSPFKQEIRSLPTRKYLPLSCGRTPGVRPTCPENPHAGKAVLVYILPGSNGGDTVKVYEGEKIPKMAANGNEIDWPAPNPDNIITREQYKELRDYASEKGISLSGFRKFDGDVDLIKEAIDTLNQNLLEFPAVVDVKHPLTLALIHTLDSDDFAVTDDI